MDSEYNTTLSNAEYLARHLHRSWREWALHWQQGNQPTWQYLSDEYKDFWRSVAEELISGKYR